MRSFQIWICGEFLFLLCIITPMLHKVFGVIRESGPRDNLEKTKCPYTCVRLCALGSRYNEPFGNESGLHEQSESERKSQLYSECAVCVALWRWNVDVIKRELKYATYKIWVNGIWDLVETQNSKLNDAFKRGTTYLTNGELTQYNPFRPVIFCIQIVVRNNTVKIIRLRRA